jgi:hypothetical protein
VEVRRCRYEKIDDESTDTPVDELIDLADSGVSLAVREMGCRIAIDSGSFVRASANLQRLAQLKLSDEKLRQLSESEGRAVIRWQEQEQLEFDFNAGSCLTTKTADGSAKSRVYVGIDGFMLPMVTDAEMGKRFEKAKARRQRLKRRKGLRRPNLMRRRGADQRYKEMKLLTMYDQEKERRLARATKSGVKQAGRMLRQMSGDCRLRRAQEVVAVTDGAEWIASLVEQDLPKPATTAILDYYHASQHVHQARRSLFGEENADGYAWANRVLELLSQGRREDWWEELISTRRRFRGKSKRRAVDDLLRYLIERKEKVDYASFRAAGFDIGSGPTESMCKSLSRRMKGIGMRWKAKNAEALVALEALHQSDLWDIYWSSRIAA